MKENELNLNLKYLNAKRKNSEKVSKGKKILVCYIVYYKVT